METTLTTLPGRGRLGRPTLLGTGTLFAALLLLFMAVWPSGDAQAASVTRTANLTAGISGDRYGFNGSPYGTLTPDSFVHKGVTYEFDFIRWDQSEQRVELGFDKCLKKSDFVSIQIGSNVYSNADIDSVWRNDDQCTNSPTRYQDIEFHGVTSNPMTLGAKYKITLTLRNPSTSAPNPDPDSSGIWTTELTRGHSSGVYGYDESDGLGSLEDRTFLYGGTNYHILISSGQMPTTGSSWS